MSDIGQSAGDLAEYWKYGFWLKDGQRDSQILVQFEDTSTSEMPGAGALQLKAQGGDPLGLLREIRRMIRQRRIGEEPEELLTLEGATVSRSALPTIINGREVFDVHKKLVPAAAFIDFFEGRERSLEDVPVAGEPTKVDISPQPLSAGEKLREVFISYAWGDKTAKGKVRAQAVESLYEALAKDGFLPIRDQAAMRTGERISAFIRHLTRADLVVAVISDKYLRSPYCMYEIYKIWQKYQGDADDLSQHLVPIILPGVKVANLVERAPYLKHWARQEKEMEALIRDPDLRPSTQSWAEFRLIQEFRHHLDDILGFVQDVLMPRNLEAHLDDGFQAVRDALRRRTQASQV